MMSFNDFNNKYKLKIKAISIIKFYQVLSSLFLKVILIQLRDGPFSSDLGIVNLHQTTSNHWVLNKNENYFDSYGCAPHQKVS